MSGKKVCALKTTEDGIVLVDGIFQCWGDVFWEIRPGRWDIEVTGIGGPRKVVRDELGIRRRVGYIVIVGGLICVINREGFF